MLVQDLSAQISFGWFLVKDGIRSELSFSFTDLAKLSDISLISLDVYCDLYKYEKSKRNHFSLASP